ncbi:hypothetical protein BT93_C1117 [Corymbia citriodora subsp. variegata]|nr:hypothetical protein BT93_C1117 [Corymbia citriodora subsp. variegata]
MARNLKVYEHCIQSLHTQVWEEMSRHAPLCGAGLDALSMEELETILRIHEEGLRQIHAIKQQCKGSPLGSPIVSPHTLPPYNHGLYPTSPPRMAVRLPSSILPDGVGMHHSNGHVNGAMRPRFNHK